MDNYTVVSKNHKRLQDCISRYMLANLTYDANGFLINMKFGNFPKLSNDPRKN